MVLYFINPDSTRLSYDTKIKKGAIVEATCNI